MKLTFIRALTFRLAMSTLTCVNLIAVSSCIKQKRSVPAISYEADSPSSIQVRNSININTASRKELEALPGIGPGLAARIVEHRERFGHFRRVEHLIMVRGLSDHRFRKLRPFVFTE